MGETRFLCLGENGQMGSAAIRRCVRLYKEGIRVNIHGEEGAKVYWNCRKDGISQQGSCLYRR